VRWSLSDTPKAHEVSLVKIAVCIKQVPARESVLRLDGNRIQDADLSYEINEPDAYALEEGLQLKEKHGGEVVVVCAGPERAGSTIRETLAKGADRAIHIEGDFDLLDPLGTATLIAKALEAEKPDLVLTGLQSDDLGYGQTGVILAELMGLPHATLIMSVEIQAATMTVKRELENGFFQHVELPLPALLTMQSGSNKLRYATLMGIKKAKTKQVLKVSAPALGGMPEATVVTTRLFSPERSKQSQIFEGDPREAAAKLVEKLRFEARAL
jgi:electron transfer flavoprotein beta subunit